VITGAHFNWQLAADSMHGWVLWVHAAATEDDLTLSPIFRLAFYNQPKGYRAAKSTAVDDSTSLKKIPSLNYITDSCRRQTDSTVVHEPIRCASDVHVVCMPVTSGRLPAHAQYVLLGTQTAASQKGVELRQMSVMCIFP